MGNSKKHIIDTSNAVFKVFNDLKITGTRLDISWNEYLFVTYLFKTNKGWTIFIENWQICCQVSEPTDVVYNTQKLTLKFNSEYMAEAISWAICRWWKGEVSNCVDNN